MRPNGLRAGGRNMTKASDVVSQSKQTTSGKSLCQLKKKLELNLTTEFRSIVLDLPVRILKRISFWRLMCLKNRCFLCVETSESLKYFI